MKKSFLLIIYICSIVSISAQSISTQALNSSGNNSVVGSIHAEWSVGEMVAVQTFIAPNTMLTQGLLQPTVAVNAPLPVTLLYFEGKTADNHNLLSWATSQEVNNHHFDIERSADGINFQLLKQVGGAGNSSGLKIYTLIDSFPHSTTWYRLKQVDTDGRFSYSRTIQLQLKDQTSLKLFPNPTTGKLNFSIKESNQSLQVSIFDMTGKLVLQQNLFSANILTLDVHHLSKGTYLIHLLSPGKRIIGSGKFIKN